MFRSTADHPHAPHPQEQTTHPLPRHCRLHTGFRPQPLILPLFLFSRDNYADVKLNVKALALICDKLTDSNLPNRVFPDEWQLLANTKMEEVPDLLEKLQEALNDIWKGRSGTMNASLSSGAPSSNARDPHSLWGTTDPPAVAGQPASVHHRQWAAATKS